MTSAADSVDIGPTLFLQQADRLKEMAAVDGMTGVFNRRHFLSLAHQIGHISVDEHAAAGG